MLNVQDVALPLDERTTEKELMPWATELKGVKLTICVRASEAKEAEHGLREFQTKALSENCWRMLRAGCSLQCTVLCGASTSRHFGVVVGRNYVAVS